MMLPGEVRSLIYACKQSMGHDALLREGLAKRLLDCCEMMLRKQEFLASQIVSLERDIELHVTKLGELKTKIIAKVSEA